MLLGFTLANTAMALVAAALFFNRPASPPLIQGVLLTDGRPVQDFSLLDHHGKHFTNRELLGQWHLVSYGFTTCPDICPTTLSQLSEATARLGEYEDDLQVLFYSVDHRRDTVQQLAAYLPFFSPDFVGLTHVDDPGNPHIPFEQSLGIVARLQPNLKDGSADPDDYQVQHGVTLFLLNPEGELQAIFEPDQVAPGVHAYDPERLVSDYLAVRRYLEG
jgi:protein SCO1/2